MSSAVFLSLDYDQVEFRVLAHESRDQRMLEIFHNREDTHSATAAEMFQIPIEQVDPIKHRLPAKCFHPDTEILTKSGWKRIEALADGEEVMQASPVGDEVLLEWSVPIARAVEHAKTLVHLKNNGINLRVTPEHRMLAWQVNPTVVLPKELNKQRKWTNAGYFFDGSWNPEERLLRLAVATEADGTYSYRRIRFGFYREDKIARLSELAGAGNYTKSSHRNGKLRDVTAFSLSRELSAAVKALLTSDKSFPWSWLSLTPACRAVVLSEIRLWDSHVPRGETQLYYGSSSQQSRDVVQALASLSGKKARSRCYGSQLTISSHAHTRGGNVEITEIDYGGKVVCLSVPSSFVLVRDGGIPIITGQSTGFGIVYGITGAGLYAQFEQLVPGMWSLEQCYGFVERYLAVRPGVVAYQSRVVAEARRQGYVSDLFGRKRWIPEVHSSRPRVRAEGERYAMNAPIQMGAQGIIRLAMGEVWDWLVEERLETRIRPVLQVHDELLFEVEEDVLAVAKTELPRLMCGVVELSVPITVSVKTGRRLGELE